MKNSCSQLMTLSNVFFSFERKLTNGKFCNKDKSFKMYINFPGRMLEQHLLKDGKLSTI